MAEQTLERADDRLRIPELSRRARLKRVLFGLVAIAVGVGAYLHYSRPEAVGETYRTDEVLRRTIVDRIEATGSLDVRSRVEVPAPIAGRLTEIHARAGQHVERGQLLATLDEQAAELALKSAAATVQAASGRVAEARVALSTTKAAAERAQRLHGKGLASAQEAQDAAAAVERASAALDAARAERELASQSVASAQLGKSLGRITAPAPGVLLRAPERLGAAVSPERGPLFVIGEPLDVMRVDAPVSETDIARIELGQSADVVVQALSGESFSARVERIAIEPQRDNGVVLYPVTLLVDNPAGALKPGMSVRIRLEVGRVENVLSVREAALRFLPPALTTAEQSPRAQVFRHVGPSELEAVPVTTGLSDGIYTEIAPADGATLAEHDMIAIGLLRPEDTSSHKPQVSLGSK